MVVKLGFNIKKLVPKPSIMQEIILISASTSFVFFVINFFGLDIVSNAFPEGFKNFIIVGIGVYLRSLFDVNILGRNLL